MPMEKSKKSGEKKPSHYHFTLPILCQFETRWGTKESKNVKSGLGCCVAVEQERFYYSRDIPGAPPLVVPFFSLLAARYLFPMSAVFAAAVSFITHLTFWKR